MCMCVYVCMCVYDMCVCVHIVILHQHDMSMISLCPIALGASAGGPTEAAEDEVPSLASEMLVMVN